MIKLKIATVALNNNHSLTIGVYRHIQQMFGYIVTTRFISLDRYNEQTYVPTVLGVSVWKPLILKEGNGDLTHTSDVRIVIRGQRP